MGAAERFDRRGCLRRLAGGLVLGGAAFAGSALASRAGWSQAPLFLGVTTSTENSGLLAHLLDAFDLDHDIEIRAVTAGSGAVLNLAARGDVDLVLVHSPMEEDAFMKAGYGIDRRAVMRNRFVIVGPKDDPADISDARDAAAAFAAIAASGALFMSRGDESGTHKAELKLWQAAGIDPGSKVGTGGGTVWYRESGSGQGATLNIAANTGAYTLTDEATFATFGNPGDLDILFASDEPALSNIYSIIRSNPERHQGVNAADALIFADWLTSTAGRAAISSFRSGNRVLFRPERQLAG